MKNSRVRALSYSVVLVAFGAGAVAQERSPAPTGVHGRVSDWQGCPLEGASVQIRDGANRTLGSAKSDAAGQYSISDLPLGPRLMEVALPGFSGQRFEPRIAAGLVTDVGLGLVAVDDSSVVLEGRVVDSRGQAVPDATVYLMPVFAPARERQQRTDASGHFSARLHKSGQFVAIAAKGGYIAHAVVVQIVSFVSRPDPVRLTLQANAACLLGSVVRDSAGNA